MEPSFLSLYSLLGCFLQVLNKDDSKSTSSGYFSILLLSNLFPRGQVCFYLTCLANTILFIVKHVCCFYLTC